MKNNLQYKRILLKLSGEVLLGQKKYGIDIDTLQFVAKEIKEIREMGVDVAISIGGGNLFRGQEAPWLDRGAADYMGILATVMNAIALQDVLEKYSVTTRVQSAIEIQRIAEPYIRRRAIRHLEKGRVVIFAGGTGNPFFSTDTAAALRAAEIGVDVLLKATKVDGIYNSDPTKDKNAVRYEKISYMEILNKELKIMDATAISLCMDNLIPIIVFSLTKPGNIKRILAGEPIGTMVVKG